MRSLLAALLSVTLIACGDTIVNLPTTPTPPPAPPPAVVRSTIEFRVTGNPSSVRVRFSTPADGLAQIVTTLPYAHRFTTTETILFLSLEVTPIAYAFSTVSPFLAAQILVNGNVFREATSNEFTLNTLIASGTWRQ